MTNRFAAWCCECRSPIAPEAGHLLGKNESTGRWEVRCEACEVTARSRARAEEEAALEVRLRMNRDQWQTDWARRESARQEEARRFQAELEELHRRAAAFHAFAMQSNRPGPGHVPQCYRMLGLTPPVDTEAVKRAYRSLAMIHHPDRGGDQGEFIRVQSAYSDALRLVGEVA